MQSRHLNHQHGRALPVAAEKCPLGHNYPETLYRRRFGLVVVVQLSRNRYGPRGIFPELIAAAVGDMRANVLEARYRRCILAPGTWSDRFLSEVADDCAVAVVMKPLAELHDLEQPRFVIASTAGGTSASRGATGPVAADVRLQVRIRKRRLVDEVFNLLGDEPNRIVSEKNADIVGMRIR